MSKDTTKGTKKVKVDKKSAAVKPSKFSTSTGDEAGTLKGIVSAQTKGKASFIMYSMDVKLEGKNVCRLLDPMKQNHGSTPNIGGGPALQGPVIVIDASALGEDQVEACNKVEEKKVTDHEKGAQDAGMLQGDYDSIRETCAQEDAIVTFRDTNPACLDHLADGVESKGHDVLTKTFEASNLAPEHEHLAGLVSTMSEKPPPGQLTMFPEEQLFERNGANLTGDYDMMDMMNGDGTRIAGESADDFIIRDALNDGLPDTAAGHRDRIMHGCQSEYGSFLAEHSDEAPIPSLFKPEAPLTAFEPDGSVYRLETKEDVLNYYKCKGSGTPKEWNLEDKATGKKVTI
jgi:hypothetical protein